MAINTSDDRNVFPDKRFVRLRTEFVRLFGASLALALAVEADSVAVLSCPESDPHTQL